MSEVQALLRMRFGAMFHHMRPWCGHYTSGRYSNSAKPPEHRTCLHCPRETYWTAIVRHFTLQMFLMDSLLQTGDTVWHGASVSALCYYQLGQRQLGIKGRNVGLNEAGNSL